MSDDDAQMLTELADSAGALRAFLDASRPVLVLSGAGISTASGIGDYRDRNGDYKRPPPVTIQQYLASPGARARYWARSLYGWPAFSRARPNRAHEALAELERAGLVGALITQNVDGLHQQAGAAQVLELHGNLHRVLCLGCGLQQSRAELQQWLLAAKQPPAWRRSRACTRWGCRPDPG